MTVRCFESHTPSIASSAYIDEAALVIGDVSIDGNASLWPGVVARGDIQSVKIGEGTNIQDNSILHVTHDNEYNPGGAALRVGKGVTVGHGAILHGCTIEDNCLIGMGSIILDGAVVQAGAIIGAGSLVSQGKTLEGGYLWLGRPAKRIRALTEKEYASLEYSAAHYVRLKNRYMGV